MREKMRRHAGVAAESETFDLKQGCGGIVDIEFMVQYAVLAWTRDEPELARWSDNVRILEALADTGRLPASQCEELKAAYLALRSATHQLALQQAGVQSPLRQFETEVDAVCSAWEGLFGTRPGSATAVDVAE
jgi:glutamate-ammonia-ligase adenylyltransferase